MVKVKIRAVCRSAQVAKNVRFRPLGSWVRWCWLARIIRGKIQADSRVRGVEI